MPTHLLNEVNVRRRKVAAKRRAKIYAKRRKLRKGKRTTYITLSPAQKRAAKRRGQMMKRTGLAKRIARFRESANLPLVIEAGVPMRHHADYIKAVLSAASLAAKLNGVTEEEAREFAQHFIDKPPVYSATAAGAAATLFEIWLMQKAQEFVETFVETVVEGNDPTFLVVFQQRLEQADLDKIQEGMKNTAKLELLVNAGDRDEEGEVSDLAVIEGTPLEAAEDQLEKVYDYMNKQNPKPEFKDKNDELARVREEGGLSNAAFRSVYPEANIKNDVAWVGETVWHNEGGMWLPLAESESKAAIVESDGVVKYETVDESRETEFKVGDLVYSVRDKSKRGRVVKVTPRGREYGSQTIYTVKTLGGDTFPANAESLRYDAESMYESLCEDGDNYVNSHYHAWAVREVSDNETHVEVRGKTYTLPFPFSEVQEAIAVIKATYNDLPQEFDVMVEAYLRDLCQMEGADIDAPAEKTVGELPEVLTESHRTFRVFASVILESEAEAKEFVDDLNEITPETSAHPARKTVMIMFPPDTTKDDALAILKQMGVDYPACEAARVEHLTRRDENLIFNAIAESIVENLPAITGLPKLDEAERPNRYFKTGDTLIVTRTPITLRRSLPGNDIKSGRKTVTAKEDGYVGGLDVYYGELDGEEVAFYGFNIVSVNGRRFDQAAVDEPVEPEESIDEGVPEQHQLKIARKTLSMSAMGARLSGVSIPQAIDILRSVGGWSDSKIEAELKRHGHSAEEISGYFTATNESLDEAKQRFTSMKEVVKAVDAGKPVYWKSTATIVTKDKNGEYNVVAVSNRYTTGLFHQDGKSTDYEAKDFFTESNESLDEAEAAKLVPRATGWEGVTQAFDVKRGKQNIGQVYQHRGTWYGKPWTGDTKEKDYPDKEAALRGVAAAANESTDEAGPVPGRKSLPFVTAQKVLKKYKKQEDDNYHTENLVMLAQFYGTPEQIKKANEIAKRHKEKGDLAREDGDWLYQNINPYYQNLIRDAKQDESIEEGHDATWKRKLFKSSADMKEWLEKNGDKIQYQEIAVNNGYGVLWRHLMRVSESGGAVLDPKDKEVVDAFVRGAESGKGPGAIIRKEGNAGTTSLYTRDGQIVSMRIHGRIHAPTSAITGPHTLGVRKLSPQQATLLAYAARAAKREGVRFGDMKEGVDEAKAIRVRGMKRKSKADPNARSTTDAAIAAEAKKIKLPITAERWDNADDLGKFAMMRAAHVRFDNPGTATSMTNRKFDDLPKDVRSSLTVSQAHKEKMDKLSERDEVVKRRAQLRLQVSNEVEAVERDSVSGLVDERSKSREQDYYQVVVTVPMDAFDEDDPVEFADTLEELAGQYDGKSKGTFKKSGSDYEFKFVFPDESDANSFSDDVTSNEMDYDDDVADQADAYVETTTSASVGGFRSEGRAFHKGDRVRVNVEINDAKRNSGPGDTGVVKSVDSKGVLVRLSDKAKDEYYFQPEDLTLLKPGKTKGESVDEAAKVSAALRKEVAGYDTADIQHDLAGELRYHKEFHADEEPSDLIVAFVAELKKRGEPLPTNVRSEYSSVSPGLRKLLYDLKAESVDEAAAPKNVGGFELENISRPGSQEAQYLVKKGEAVLGMVTKFKDTRTDTHPWKVFHATGAQRQMTHLGFIYGGNKTLEKAVKAAAAGDKLPEPTNEEEELDEPETFTVSHGTYTISNPKKGAYHLAYRPKGSKRDAVPKDMKTWHASSTAAWREGQRHSKTIAPAGHDILVGDPRRQYHEAELDEIDRAVKLGTQYYYAEIDGEELRKAAMKERAVSAKDIPDGDLDFVVVDNPHFVKTGNAQFYDPYLMLVLHGNRVVYSYGTHPSLPGAKKFIANRVAVKNADDSKGPVLPQLWRQIWADYVGESAKDNWNEMEPEDRLELLREVAQDFDEPIHKLKPFAMKKWSQLEYPKLRDYLSAWFGETVDEALLKKKKVKWPSQKMPKQGTKAYARWYKRLRGATAKYGSLKQQGRLGEEELLTFEPVFDDAEIVEVDERDDQDAEPLTERGQTNAELIRQAARSRSIIRMEYKKLDGHHKSYVLEVYSYRVKRPERTGGRPAWYLYARDMKEGHIKSYVVNNINRVTVTEKHYKPKWPVEFSPVRKVVPKGVRAESVAEDAPKASIGDSVRFTDKDWKEQYPDVYTVSYVASNGYKLSERGKRLPFTFPFASVELIGEALDPDKPTGVNVIPKDGKFIVYSDGMDKTLAGPFDTQEEADAAMSKIMAKWESVDASEKVESIDESTLQDYVHRITVTVPVAEMQKTSQLASKCRGVVTGRPTCTDTTATIVARFKTIEDRDAFAYAGKWVTDAQGNVVDDKGNIVDEAANLAARPVRFSEVLIRLKDSAEAEEAVSALRKSKSDSKAILKVGPGVNQESVSVMLDLNPPESAKSFVGKLLREHGLQVNEDALTATVLTSTPKQISEAHNPDTVSAPLEPLAKHYTQYIKTGNAYVPSGKAIATDMLERSAYALVWGMGGVQFERVQPKTDQLYRYESGATETVLEEIDRFWNLKEAYNEVGLRHARGILLYGPPGMGKSSMIHQIAEMIVSRGDVVFFAKDIGALKEGLSRFREVEPERKVVVVLEDMDEYISHGQRDLLNLLDGDNAQEGVLYLGTTNYINSFPPRLLRSGRFDKKVFVGPPEESARMAYFQNKLHDKADMETVRQLVKDSDGMNFGDLKELVVATHVLKEPIQDAVKRIRGARIQESVEKTDAVLAFEEVFDADFSSLHEAYKDRAFIDYSAGKFEAYTNAEGRRHILKTSEQIAEVVTFLRRNKYQWVATESAQRWAKEQGFNFKKEGFNEAATFDRQAATRARRFGLYRWAVPGSQRKLVKTGTTDQLNAWAQKRGWEWRSEPGSLFGGYYVDNRIAYVFDLLPGHTPDEPTQEEGSDTESRPDNIITEAGTPWVMLQKAKGGWFVVTENGTKLSKEPHTTKQQAIDQAVAYKLAKKREGVELEIRSHDAGSKDENITESSPAQVIAGQMSMTRVTDYVDHFQKIGLGRLKPFKQVVSDNGGKTAMFKWNRGDLWLYMNVTYHEGSDLYDVVTGLYSLTGPEQYQIQSIDGMYAEDLLSPDKFFPSAKTKTAWQGMKKGVTTEAADDKLDRGTVTILHHAKKGHADKPGDEGGGKFLARYTKLKNLGLIEVKGGKWVLTDKGQAAWKKYYGYTEESMRFEPVELDEMTKADMRKLDLMRRRMQSKGDILDGDTQRAIVDNAENIKCTKSGETTDMDFATFKLAAQNYIGKAGAFEQVGPNAYCLYTPDCEYRFTSVSGADVEDVDDVDSPDEAETGQE